jgi:hypothetical protein
LRRRDQLCVGNPNAAERWQWSCGFYPGSEPGEHRHGTAPSFEAARRSYVLGSRGDTGSAEVRSNIAP